VGSDARKFQVILLTREEDNRVHTATARAEAAQVEERQSNKMILANASGHVTMARIMRRFAQDITLADIQQFRGDTPYSQRDYVLVGDYGENLSAPYFGGAQAGDTYYFLPLTVFSFGLVDLSTGPNKINCYTYSEDKGKKGANNLASLLMHDLKSRGWLHNEPANSLTVIFDNCGGQNKNNVMLRLAPYLVEKGFFKEVTIAFYVCGYTKNVCDRLFNKLKLRYDKQNVYTVHQVIKVMNSQPNVTAIGTDSHHFLDYEKMLDKIYHKLEAGTIQRNHVFSVKKNWDSIGMEKREHIDADTVVQNLLKKGQHAGMPERNELLNERFLEKCAKPGLREIKQVELYTKLKKFVPLQWRDEICPKPSDETLIRVKMGKAAKAKERAGAAKK
jgi:hypothetical protein